MIASATNPRHLQGGAKVTKAQTFAEAIEAIGGQVGDLYRNAAGATLYFEETASFYEAGEYWLYAYTTNGQGYTRATVDEINSLLAMGLLRRVGRIAPHGRAAV